MYETLAISAPTVVDAALRRSSREIQAQRLESWAANVVRHARMHVTVSGRENMVRGRTYVIMSNHQSHYDVPVLYAVLGGYVRMVAKKELFSIPLFGRAMRDAGFIEVDRKNRRKSHESLDDAKKQLASGIHIWIAPEGTRSTTGAIADFKKGGFVVAMGTGAPILPITIQGTRDALPSGAALSTPGAEVRVKIHPVIETEGRGTSKEAREALVAEVRAAIVSGVT